MSTAGQESAERTANSLHSAAIHLLRKLRRADSSSGLNAPRLSALSVIVFGGPLTLGQLAQAEQVKPPTMTRIVHALTAKGLVKKTANPEDARALHLSATLKGKRLLFRARERRVQPLTAQIESLPRNEQEKLHAALGILENVIGGL
jgi:DNA-binding MarR family transcriptional regulator